MLKENLYIRSLASIRRGLEPKQTPPILLIVQNRLWNCIRMSLGCHILPIQKDHILPIKRGPKSEESCLCQSGSSIFRQSWDVPIRRYPVFCQSGGVPIWRGTCQSGRVILYQSGEVPIRRGPVCANSGGVPIRRGALLAKLEGSQFGGVLFFAYP